MPIKTREEITKSWKHNMCYHLTSANCAKSFNAIKIFFNTNRPLTLEEKANITV